MSEADDDDDLPFNFGEICMFKQGEAAIQASQLRLHLPQLVNLVLPARQVGELVHGEGGGRREEVDEDGCIVLAE